MIRTPNIHSLSDFQRNAKAYIQQVTQSKDPIAITVNGEAEVVIQDAHVYQAMVDELERVRFIMAIQEGEQAIQDGRVRPAASVVRSLKAKHGL